MELISHIASVATNWLIYDGQTNTAPTPQQPSGESKDSFPEEGPQGTILKETNKPSQTLKEIIQPLEDTTKSTDPDPSSLTCIRCSSTTITKTKPKECTNCTKNCCDACYLSAIKAGITKGNTGTMKCPCSQYKIIYKQIRLLSKDLGKELVDKFNNDLRNYNSGGSYLSINCPHCKYSNDVPTTAMVFTCRLPGCAYNGCELCVRHQIPLMKTESESYCERCCVDNNTQVTK